MSQDDDPVDESFETTIGDLLQDDGTARYREQAEDPNFATPEEANPFAAADLQQQAARTPRMDKQGDLLPDELAPAPLSEQGSKGLERD